ncbi:type II secretion system F family protein [Candidatus Uhrbacteria bacterium]|nr:type II secretion system F family protein [Candidatus Uhrbacteria bacterium]
MPKYEYRATDRSGATVAGLVESDNLELAADTLKDRNLTVISLSEHRKGGGEIEINLPFFDRVKIRDLVIFSRQFAVLMGAKVPVIRALRTVASQTENRRLKAIVLDIADESESGLALSVAMAKHPNAFSQFYVNMIRSGETTGRLEDVMDYLADQMERDYDLMTKIKGAMTYPIVVIIALVIVGFVMMTFVVPKMTAVLTESGTALPWTTRLLIVTSEFMRDYVIQIVVGIVAAAVGLGLWNRTPNGKRFIDGAILRLPVFGMLLQRIYLVRFTRSFGTLVEGGVDIPASLEVCADVVGNEKYRELIVQTRKEVMDGHSISGVFGKDGSMPKMVPQMMAVGEETGRLADVMDKLTVFYSRELSNLVDNLVSAIEPIIMLVMGGAVGIMVAAIMLPMYNMATSM